MNWAHWAELSLGYARLSNFGVIASLRSSDELGEVWTTFYVHTSYNIPLKTFTHVWTWSNQGEIGQCRTIMFCIENQDASSWMENFREEKHLGRLFFVLLGRTQNAKMRWNIFWDVRSRMTTKCIFMFKAQIMRFIVLVEISNIPFRRYCFLLHTILVHIYCWTMQVKLR